MGNRFGAGSIKGDGDLDAARDHYQAGLDIRTRLAATDPANTQWQRDLEYVRKKIADLTARAPES